MLNDLRYAFRALTRAPGFTTMAALTLALGIGANTAIFAVVQAVLLQPLPFKNADRLAKLSEGRPDFRLNVSYPNFLDWRARSRTFEEMAICLPFGSSVMGGAVRAEVAATAKAEARLFPLLGADPVLGRNFSAEEETAAGPPVILISDRLWRKRFGGAADVPGKSLTLDGEAYTIVGVLPAEFRLVNVDVWFPLGRWLRPNQLDRGNHPGFNVYARLRDGVDFTRAQQEMTSIAADLERQYPQTNARIGVFVTPLSDELLGGARSMMLLLSSAVSLLLLIACANVANVLLARGLHREREAAVRSALGAGRWRLVRLFVCEGIVIALAGSALSALVAGWAVRAVRGMPGLALPRSADITMSVEAFAYAVVLALATVLLFAVAPAMQLSRVRLVNTLRLTGPSASAPARGRILRTTLIAVEVALSLMLLVGATLMLRTVWRILSVDPGFDAAPLLTAGVIHPRHKYGADDRVRQFGARTVEDLRAIPGVADAAVAFPLSMIGSTWTPKINRPDRPFAAGQEPAPLTAAVTEGFFTTMGIPLRKGRIFDESERPGAPAAAIVNETFVREVLGGDDPLGRRISAPAIPGMKDMTIVGVVGDTRRSGLMTSPRPELYISYTQFPSSDPNVVVRVSSGDPLAVARAVDERIAAIDPDVPVVLPRRVSDILERSVTSRRSILMLLALFAAIALGLTGLGIAGVVSFVVTQRTPEIGVRMALGADAAAVVRLVMRGAMPPVLIGLAAGAAATVPFSRLIRSFLFQVEPTDVLSLLVGAGVLVVSALLAAWIPARRATRIDPVAALRST